MPTPGLSGGGPPPAPTQSPSIAGIRKDIVVAPTEQCMGPERRSAMIDRREFLAVLATAVAALGTREAIAGSPHAQRDVLPVADLGRLQKAYTFFNPTEAEFIEAAIARLIPNDDLGQGALERDDSYFIDRLMPSDYGSD